MTAGNKTIPNYFIEFSGQKTILPIPQGSDKKLTTTEVNDLANKILKIAQNHGSADQGIILSGVSSMDNSSTRFEYLCVDGRLFSPPYPQEISQLFWMLLQHPSVSATSAAVGNGTTVNILMYPSPRFV